MNASTTMRLRPPQHPIRFVLPSEGSPFPSLRLPFTVNKLDGVFSRLQIDPMTHLQKAKPHRKAAKNAKENQVFPLRISADPLRSRRFRGFLQLSHPL